MIIDTKSLIPYKGTMLKFVLRSKPGYDFGISDEKLMSEMFIEDVYEIEDKTLDDTGVIIDIGGNIGAFDMQCFILGAKKIYSYEPEKENYGMLLTNIKLNGAEKIIKPIKKAVGGEVKKVRLVQGQAATYVEGCKQLGGSVTPPSADEEVNMIRLVDVFTENKIPYCDVLKVDIEGSEYSLFKSATSDVLNKCRYICIEFHGPEKNEFGNLIEKLSLTHQIKIVGKYNYGGQIFATRF